MSTSTNIATSLLSRAHSPTTTAQIYTEKIQSRPLHLKPTPSANTRDLRRLRRPQKTSPKPLSAKQKRLLNIHTIPPAESKHALYRPLHGLWIAYMQDILGMQAANAHITGEMAGRLSTADFHGAEIEVVRSGCVSRVGVKGIVVRDSKFAFRVVTRGDRVKLLPKEGTIFRVEVPWPAVEGGRRDGGDMERGGGGGEEEGKEGDEEVVGMGKGRKENTETETKKVVFELYGDQFQYRAADRAKHKFKPRFYKNL